MPRVRLKIPAWLIHGEPLQSPAFHETFLNIEDLGCFTDAIHYLSQGHQALQNLIKDKMFGIILNGVYVNPHDPSETPIKEGDELTLIPLMDGG